MAYWIMKTEPETFSWDDLVEAGSTTWDGVRNFQARNNLQAMKVGDEALIYHSVSERAAVGIGRIAKSAEPDVTFKGPKNPWVVVTVVPLQKLKKPVGLDAIKGNKKLAGLALIKQSRLSVVPVTAAEWKTLLAMSQ